MSAQMASILMDNLRARGEFLMAPEESLTSRERQIVKLISAGKSAKKIGELLFISSRTVQNHRANIMKKLNFKKTVDLVKYAVQKDYVTDSTF
jgi:DNA-binding CsgD family transcriptional regulator